MASKSMVTRRHLFPACAIVLAMSPPSRAQTSASPQPRSDVSVQHNQDGSDPRLRIDVGDTGPRVPGTFTFGGLTLDGRFQTDTSLTSGGFGSTWQATASARYRAPAGFVVSAGIVARRGYRLPLFMTTAAGGDEAIASMGQSIAATSRVPVLFDTRVRVQRHLITRGGLNVDFVAEGLNLLNANVGREHGDISPTLTSRTFRAGLVFGF